MKKEEAVKYLQQLYPYGGHCWLDKQRTEAIGMAIQALQEEPVSESLEKAATKYAQDKYMPVQTSQAFKAGAKWQQEKEYTCYEEAFEDGAKWKKEQMLKDAVEGKVLINGMGNPILHLWDKGKHLIDKKVKVILIKEE